MYTQYSAEDTAFPLDTVRLASFPSPGGRGFDRSPACSRRPGRHLCVCERESVIAATVVIITDVLCPLSDVLMTCRPGDIAWSAWSGRTSSLQSIYEATHGPLAWPANSTQRDIWGGCLPSSISQFRCQMKIDIMDMRNQLVDLACELACKLGKC